MAFKNNNKTRRTVAEEIIDGTLVNITGNASSVIPVNLLLGYYNYSRRASVNPVQSATFSFPFSNGVGFFLDGILTNVYIYDITQNRNVAPYNTMYDGATMQNYLAAHIIGNNVELFVRPVFKLTVSGVTRQYYTITSMKLI